MFGTVDILFSLRNKITKEEKENANKFNKQIIDRGDKLTWICFLPWRTNIKTARKYNLLPIKGNLIIYETPLNLISEEPQKTREALYSLVNDFEKTYAEKELVGKEIAFLGISIGSIPAFFLANRYKSQKICAICSTAKLGDGIFRAFAARKIKRSIIENGLDADLYDKVLNEINPIENISNLPVDIKIVISRFDNFVPYCGGEELAKKIREMNKSVKILRFNFFGHLMTMVRIGRLNRKYDFFK